MYNSATTEVGFAGEKTHSLPKDYVSAVNKLMDDYSLLDKMKALDNVKYFFKEYK